MRGKVLPTMKDAKDLLPWHVTDISIRPYEGFWSFNPSIHFDGTLWRCAMRSCDYAMPSGVTIRSKKAGSGQHTKNAMVIFDPQTWKPVQIFKMHENDGLPREVCSHTGFEDMRIFSTAKGGLQGIAASLHLKREQSSRPEGSLPHQPPEQVLLSFDDNYNIINAKPIRGKAFSNSQKNWVPFDGFTEPRFLYSIDNGTLFDENGPIGTPRPVVESSQAAVEPPKPDKPKRPSISSVRRGDVQIMQGSRVVLGTASIKLPRSVANRSEAVQITNPGKALLPRYSGLRGGTQLCRVSDDLWLGIGHEMKFVNGKKYYWHIFYTVDSQGALKTTSEPMKLAQNGIEFAAGMAIDGDRVVISFGVDDMESKLGETRLEAVMGLLQHR